ncbi:hypothetical protein HU200_007144 [Digitaria exilis]|uniref:RNase H type-1 domain-containing protein n=1 Tax=Digitaria exilis TaxID=1010633 RepID=A0A835FQM1_9POAL|nr:hypothetical protein HU200_007144 [Digitaria exilis]
MHFQWSTLHHCASVEEVEALAYHEGVRLAAEWVRRPTILECEVKIVRRECNRVAHELAQLAKRTVHSAVWRENAPACINELLLDSFPAKKNYFNFFLKKILVKTHVRQARNTK